MLTLKKICAFMAIASCATIFSSSNEEVMLDTNADRNSITLKKSGSNEISTTENKIIGRDCPYLKPLTNKKAEATLLNSGVAVNKKSKKIVLA